jgi:hypothetical protein
MNIEPSLEHLLKRQDPFICLLKGEWGVGKTYFIKKFIRDYHDIIAKQSYSYVSLFGISSSADLMHAIYLNTVPTRTLGTSLTEALSRSSSEEAIDRSGRCRLGEATFAGMGGKEEDAPITAIRDAAIRPPEFDLSHWPNQGPNVISSFRITLRVSSRTRAKSNPEGASSPLCT